MLSVPPFASITGTNVPEQRAENFWAQCSVVAVCRKLVEPLVTGIGALPLERPRFDGTKASARLDRTHVRRPERRRVPPEHERAVREKCQPATRPQRVGGHGWPDVLINPVPRLSGDDEVERVGRRRPGFERRDDVHATSVGHGGHPLVRLHADNLAPAIEEPLRRDTGAASDVQDPSDVRAVHHGIDRRRRCRRRDQAERERGATGRDDL